MLKPLHDHIVLEVEKKENKTASGIILTESSKEEPSYAKVVAVGDGKYIDGKKIPLAVSVGDVVIFKKYATTDVKIDGKEYLIVSEKDVLAILE